MTHYKIHASNSAFWNFETYKNNLHEYTLQNMTSRTNVNMPNSIPQRKTHRLMQRIWQNTSEICLEKPADTLNVFE